ncbi:hypothetical protein ABW20_dc0102882 [Dactylellina cionopaga]|nr:hypothetical protein ABW20_dc0102882 [Dactylellina cionopaga]
MPRAVDLPSRVLLTALFDSFAAIKSTSSEAATVPPKSTFAGNQVVAPNPLRNLPAESRNLFLTAHCLLPVTFLAALDILEKSLVVRYTAASSYISTTSSPDTSPQVYYIRSNPPPPQSLAIPGPNFTATSKPNVPKSARSYVYEVRPSSWNCTCIAFTLTAYQRHTLLHTQNKTDRFGDESGVSDEEKVDVDSGAVVGETGPTEDEIQNTGVSGVNDDEENQEGNVDRTSGPDSDDDETRSESGAGKNIWYGGVSTLTSDATGTRRKAKRLVVPVCKHLLAAVLAEKCKGLFGGYVVEKVVTADEIAEMAVLWE